MRLFAAYVGVVTLLAGLAGCAKDDARPGPTPLQLFDLDGRPFDLWPAEPPAVSVVVFTRTDCPIANRYAPEVRRLYELYQPRGVAFFLIYVDPLESPDDIRRHLAEYAYPCRGVRDPRHALAAHCQATVTPEAVVFDRNRAMTYRGRIDDLYADLGKPRAGPTTHDLADAIESTLHGRPVATPRTKAVGCRIGDLKE